MINNTLGKPEWMNMREWVIDCYPQDEEEIMTLAPHEIVRYVNNLYGQIRKCGIALWFLDVTDIRPLLVCGKWYVFNPVTKLYYTGNGWVKFYHCALEYRSFLHALKSVPDEF